MVLANRRQIADKPTSRDKNISNTRNMIVPMLQNKMHTFLIYFQQEDGTKVSGDVIQEYITTSTYLLGEYSFNYLNLCGFKVSSLINKREVNGPRQSVGIVMNLGIHVMATKTRYGIWS